jgi:threonine aldolase
VDEMAREGVITLALSDDAMRLVTHRDVSAEDVETSLKAFRKVLRAA